MINFVAMPYITNFHSELATTNLKIDKLELVEDEVLSRVKILSKEEKLQIFAYKKLLANDEDLVQIYKPISKRTSKFVTTTQNPRYHTDKNCKVLNNDFISYTIPPSILKKGEEDVAKYRKWFKQNKALLESDPSTFYDKQKEAFNTSEKLESVKFDNSGVTEIENLSIEEIEAYLEKLITDYDTFISSESTSKAISLNSEKAKYLVGAGTKYVKYAETGLSSEEVIAILKKYLAMKKDTIKYLQMYYRVKLNPDLSIDTKLLEGLGFLECPYCAKYKNRYRRR